MQKKHVTSFSFRGKHQNQDALNYTACRFRHSASSYFVKFYISYVAKGRTIIQSPKIKAIEYT